MNHRQQPRSAEGARDRGSAPQPARRQASPAGSLPGFEARSNDGHLAAPGTRPQGLSDADAARHVHGMFDAIAPTYDRANHLLSLSVDRYWRRRTVRELRRTLAASLPRPATAPRILDICCGTGDLSLALRAGWGQAQVLGADFSRPMLQLARAKGRNRNASQLPVAWLQADAMRLPFADSSLTAIATGFGFRNLSDYRAGLREFLRLLQPGGALAILEISRPTTPLAGAAFQFYFTRVLPRLGGWISGAPQAYRYLPESVGRFPAPPVLAQWMRECGFEAVRYRRLAGGIAALHLGVRPV